MRSLLLSISVCLAFLSASPTDDAHGCDIPVFRYALEQWQPDPYEIYVVHRKPLSVTHQAVVDSLAAKVSDPAAPANAVVQLASLDDPPPRLRQTAMLTNYADDALPQLVVLYPTGQATGQLAYSAPLSEDNVARLLSSPARTEIIRRLLDGESAVWVLIESGNAAADARAAQVLAAELERMHQVIELPPVEVIETDDQFKSETVVRLRLAFSLLRLRRDDPQEAALVSTLLGTEADLRSLEEPIAIPIYGRGHTHFALVGSGIVGDVIEDDCRFIAGRCSCEVKKENPGCDLLMAVDWEGQIIGAAERNVELPELTALGDLAALVATEATPPGASQESDSKAANIGANEPERRVPPGTSSLTTDASREAKAPLSRTLAWSVAGLVVVGLLAAIGGSVVLARRDE